MTNGAVTWRRGTAFASGRAVLASTAEAVPALSSGPSALAVGTGVGGALAIIGAGTAPIVSAAPALGFAGTCIEGWAGARRAAVAMVDGWAFIRPVLSWRAGAHRRNNGTSTGMAHDQMDRA